MSKAMKAIILGSVMFFAGAVLATDTPPSLPDGPVASPKGWSCTSSGGVVTFVRKSTQQQ